MMQGRLLQRNMISHVCDAESESIVVWFLVWMHQSHMFAYTIVP